ncbi:MAG: ABC transporter ATP-binding protein [Clostridia bacterium]|nr:ABC transporter ATP-binding protein [Clostridia bacterium]MBQ5802158.1 ABC transporter ATP-binding protein [Clostridia bacterium]
MKRNTYNVDEELKTRFNLRYLLRILRYALPYKAAFITAFVTILSIVALSMLRPLVNEYIIDKLLPNPDYRAFTVIIVVLLALSVAEIVGAVVQSTLLNRAGYKIVYQIRNDVFKVLQDLDFDFYDNRPAGKIVVRATSYIDELATFFAAHLVNMLVNVLKLIILLAFIYLYEWHLAVVTTCTVIPIFLFITLMRKLLNKRLFKLRNADSNRAAFITENVAGHMVIKSFNRKDLNLKIYMDDVFEPSKQRWHAFLRVNNLFGPGLELLWNIGTIALLATSFFLIGSQTVGITLGTVVAFMSYTAMFSEPITVISGAFQQLSNVSSYVERIFELMDTVPKIRNKQGAEDVTYIRGDVSFENVAFSYDGETNILENFNFTANAGQSIALVGATGAGKTTVVNLINRFYDVTDGAVKIDGKDVRDFTLHSLRSRVGVMLQDSFIFRGSVMENIRYGKADATDEECIAAAKLIHADEFIEKMPRGYHTKLSENGVGLSQGEKQLINFARIILKNPSVLILDEATSSIDTDTERKIQEALNTVLKGRTSFIIAHRLSTIKECDCILYIGNKGILERGTHEELLEKNGLYAALTNAH